MPNLDQDPGFHDQIEKTVQEIERQTSAEVVVVIASKSGSYRDIDYLTGAATALVALALMRSLPQFMPAWSVLPEMIVSFWIGVLLSRTFWPIRRFFSNAARRQQQVVDAARQAFLEESVHCTRQRTGVLIYCSLAERHVEVVCDVAVEAKIQSSTWKALTGALRHPSRRVHLLDELRALARPLAAAFPATGDNPDEIPNRPRVRG